MELAAKIIQEIVANMAMFVLIALAAAIVVGMASNLLSRVGYSWWYAFLILIPFYGFFVLLVFALREWPIERKLARLRLIAGESGDIDSDIEMVTSLAIAHEQNGQWNEAITLYNLVFDKSMDSKVKQYATECIARLTRNN
jgi:hypothetical protein